MNDTTFNPDTVSNVFKAAYKSDNAKANKEAIILACEFLRLFTVEAIHRASDEQDIMNTTTTVNEASNTLEVEHLERILPQLLLDF
ncbi:centromere protein X [Cokeromyces recurvatus]|uniref:centromere protein X n=1 Tax=Cokeromyces recurvatus TaxID=90255 RepID=UPI00221FA95D|nr:centromere protein X [Cokeromyces recurvatus]KAI7902369.1 centromere protein X [Cokeromyces recurvatus]